MALFPLEPFSLLRILCSSICDDQKGVLLQNRYPSQEASPKSSLLIQQYLTRLSPPQSINQSKHRTETTGKGRSLKDPNSLPRRNCCQPFRNRMYFLKLMACQVMASSCSWIPLFSAPCLPVEPWPPGRPWLVRSSSPGRALRPCPPSYDLRCRIWDQRAKTRSQLSSCLSGHLPAD